MWEWVQAIPAWVSLMSGVGLPLILFFYKAAQDRLGRQDQRSDREQAADDARDASIAREREQLAANNVTLIANLRTDLDRCRAEKDDISADRYRGWNVARVWYDRATAWRQALVEAIHQARGARQVAESIARLQKIDLPQWDRPIDDAPPLSPFDPK